MTQRKERKKQYDEGFDDAMHQVQMLLAVSIETFPEAPSETMVNRIMEAGSAGAILDLLKAYRERAARKRGKEQPNVAQIAS